jgi:GPH family glycoside/pentoside/hexuronide:cation symporter
LCSATFLVFNGYQLGVSFALYVMIYYIFGGNDQSAGALNGWWGSLTAICTIIVIPVTALISKAVGKKQTFMITISLSIFGYALKWIGYNPDMPYLLLISCPFVAFGTGSLFTLMGSMISDVCDYDELKSHQRREGVFGAIFWWMVKVGMALAGLLGGYLLMASGFVTPVPDATEPVVQSAETLFYLRLCDVVIPIITSIAALIIMSTYEISETKANEIRAELEQRRGKLEA